MNMSKIYATSIWENNTIFKNLDLSINLNGEFLGGRWLIYVLREFKGRFSLKEKFLRRKVKVHFMRILGSIPPLFLINYRGNLI